MRPAAVCAVVGLLFLAMSCLALLDASAQTQPPAGSEQAGGQKSQPSDQGAIPLKAPTTPHPFWIVIVTVILGLLVIALSIAGRNPQNPYIRRLGPSFFFWLGMGYLALLLVMVVFYITNCYGIQQLLPDPVAGMMPIAVPWFGALGAVVISLQGVYDHNDHWDPKFNYWHIGRPLFGAVVGIVAFFLLTLTITASGTQPANPAKTSTNIIYFVLAFLVGYREETFRELLKRAVDLILQPGGTPAPAPSVTFKVAGASPLVIDFPPTAPATPSRVVVEVHNTGNAPLVTPTVTVKATDPAPAGTFQLANDHVTGGADLASGAFRTVEVVFTPNAAGQFSGTLTVTATNLSSPKTIQLSGTGTGP